MEINPNVDDLLIETANNIKLDPLPDKPLEEVSRETNGQESGQLKVESVPKEASVDKLSDNSPPKKEEAVITNEYGDKAEPSITNGSSEPETNEYGLETEASKTYSKAEMDAYANQIVRERLARLERNTQQPPTQQQQQQANQAGFQFDENSNLDWAQQLESFVMQVADRRDQTRAAQIQQAIEQERMQEFEGKFKAGMEKFDDYHTVLKGKKITDAMVEAASDINDPAALFYAAAKREPAELDRISKIENPFAQAAAIGRLDAKLRKVPVKASNAPRPVSPSKADTAAKTYAPKEVSDNELDDLLIADNKARLAQQNARRR